MKRVLVGLAILMAGPVTAAPSADGVKDAWVRINPAPGRPAAGYFVLTNGAAADALVGADVPGARVEMHVMTMDGGVMRMSAIEKVALKPGETVAFKSGGYHLMIFGLDKPGASLPRTLAVTLRFASGAKVTVPAAVRTAAAGMGGAMGAAQPNPHAGH